MITITTDGACSGNPGPGGYAATLQYGAHQRVLQGHARHTTNNRMELLAVIVALRALRKTGQVITVFSDSRYVVQGMTEWLSDWQRRGWKNARKKPVENRDLWEQLAQLATEHQITWTWVKGHDTHAGNLQADQLAGEAMNRQLHNEFDPEHQGELPGTP